MWYRVLLRNLLKLVFVYQRAMFLILRLPQVIKAVLRFQICDYVVRTSNIFNVSISFLKIPIFQYDFKIIITVVSKTTSTQKQRNGYRQNQLVDFGLNLSEPQL